MHGQNHIKSVLESYSKCFYHSRDRKFGKCLSFQAISL